MAATATGSVSISMVGNLTNTLTDQTAVPATIGNDVKKTFSTSGTAADQFNRGWKRHDWTLADTASVNFDMYDLGTIDIGAGNGEDPLGLNQANTELVAMMIESQADSVGSLFIGGEGSAAAWQSMFHVSGSLSDTAGLKLLPGATFCIVAPKQPAYVIVDASNHLLKFAAAGGAVDFNANFFFRGA